MNINDLMTKHNLILPIMLKNGDESLSKDLKVKVMSMRIEYGKIRHEFESDVQEFIKGVTPEKFTTLQSKENKTPEEEKEFQSIIDNINSEYNSYVKSREDENFTVKYDKFTEEEYNEIISVMGGEDVIINNNKIPSVTYLEYLYKYFVA